MQEHFHDNFELWFTEVNGRVSVDFHKDRIHRAAEMLVESDIWRSLSPVFCLKWDSEILQCEREIKCIQKKV